MNKLAVRTNNLNILLIQPTDYFADVSFNAVINDLDTKVVGIVHLKSKGHWDTWQSSFTYAKGDIIRISNSKSNQYYQCVTAGTSGTVEPANNIAGSVVTDGTVKWMVYEMGVGSSTSGIRLWLAGDYYIRGEVVLYNNALYRCVVDHLANSTFAQDAVYFTTLCANLRKWASSVYYRTNDVVVSDNNLYICNNDHTSQSTFSADLVDWDLLNSFGLVLEHQLNHVYLEGEMVTVNNRLYRCNTAHTSSTLTFSNDINNWDLITAQIPSWVASNYYNVGDIIQDNDIMYKCITAHTSTTSLQADIANWTLFPRATAIIEDWTASKYYEAGQVVYYLNKIYRCTQTNSDATFNIAKWESLSNGNLNDWIVGFLYTPGDTIVYNKKIYKCLTSHTSTSFNADFANWEEISASRIDDWAVGVKYVVGDLVTDGKAIYRCKSAHTSTNFLNNLSNWDLLCELGLVDAWQTNTYYFAGQLVHRDNTIYRASVSHTSTTSFQADTANWEVVNAQIQEYISNKFYKKDEIVIKDNKLWQALRDNVTTDFNLTYQTSSAIIPFTIHDSQTGTFTLQTPVTQTVDIGTVTYVTHVSFNNYGGNGGQWNTVAISFSVDNTTFTTPSTFNVSAGGDFDIPVDQDIRYIRFVGSVYDDWETGLGSVVQNNVRLQHFKVYGNKDWKQLYDEIPPKVKDWTSNTKYERNEIIIKCVRKTPAFRHGDISTQSR